MSFNFKKKSLIRNIILIVLLLLVSGAACEQIKKVDGGSINIFSERIPTIGDNPSLYIPQNSVTENEIMPGTYVEDIEIKLNEECTSSFEEASEFKIYDSEFNLCVKKNDGGGSGNHPSIQEDSIGEAEIAAGTYIKNVNIIKSDELCPNGFFSTTTFWIYVTTAFILENTQRYSFQICVELNGDGDGASLPGVPMNSITEYHITSGTYWENLRVVKGNCNSDETEIETFGFRSLEFKLCADYNDDDISGGTVITPEQTGRYCSTANQDACGDEEQIGACFDLCAETYGGGEEDTCMESVDSSSNSFTSIARECILQSIRSGKSISEAKDQCEDFCNGDLSLIHCGIWGEDEKSECENAIESGTIRETIEVERDELVALTEGGNGYCAAIGMECEDVVCTNMNADIIDCLDVIRSGCSYRDYSSMDEDVILEITCALFLEEDEPSSPENIGRICAEEYSETEDEDFILEECEDVCRGWSSELGWSEQQTQDCFDEVITSVNELATGRAPVDIGGPPEGILRTPECEEVARDTGLATEACISGCCVLPPGQEMPADFCCYQSESDLSLGCQGRPQQEITITSGLPPELGTVILQYTSNYQAYKVWTNVEEETETGRKTGFEYDARREGNTNKYSFTIGERTYSFTSDFATNCAVTTPQITVTQECYEARRVAGTGVNTFRADCNPNDVLVGITVEDINIPGRDSDDFSAICCPLERAIYFAQQN